MMTSQTLPPPQGDDNNNDDDDYSNKYKDRVTASLYGMLVGDALAMPAHWFYSPTKLRNDYGEITGMVEPKQYHAESMVQGMTYKGTLDIMHDKAQYYEGNTLADEINKKQKHRQLSKEDIEANRDDHGNYVGHKASERVHYHGTLTKGQNTANMCIGRLLIRYLGEVNRSGFDHYDPDEFLERLKEYMLQPPDPIKDKDQLINHNDTYLDVYLRGFFAKASSSSIDGGGSRPLRECAMSQRDTWSIGSLDGVAMSIPIIAAYSNEPEYMVLGRAVEHHYLTHRSITVTATIAALVTILLELYHDNKEADLRKTLDKVMDKMHPPKITGREIADSYVTHKGPGNIPKYEKWLQHVEFDKQETTKQLIHRMIECDNDEDVAGFRDQEASRLSTLCYCEHTFTTVLYLAYKYGPNNPRKALLQNVMIGGHSTSRGAVLGAILGAAHGCGSIDDSSELFPFANDLCAKECIQKEINTLVATIR